MEFKLELPGKNTLEHAMRVAAGTACCLVILKLTGAIIDAAKENRQNKQIKRLKKQVSDLEERVEALEKNN